MTTTEQLDLILPWLNGDLRHDVAVRRALWRFIEARGRTGVLRNPEGFREASDLVDDAKADELEAVRNKVVMLLAAGIGRPLNPRGDRRGHEPDQEGNPLPLPPFTAFPSLRFGIHKGSMEAGGGPGGMRLRDLVPFLVLLLMASPDLKGNRGLRWCTAPEPGQWSLGQCGRFFVWGGRGRPQVACSPACITRRRDRDLYVKDKARIARRAEKQRRERQEAAQKVKPMLLALKQRIAAAKAAQSARKRRKR